MHIQTSKMDLLDLGFGGYTCNWGTHLCALYETEQERDEIVLGFLCSGNAAGDLQMYCAEDRLRKDFADRLSLRCPDCARQLGNPDRFCLYAPQQLYYPDGTFSPDSMDRNLTALYDLTQAAGPRNVRVTGEMIWSRQAIPGVEHLMVYEARMNSFVPKRRVTAVCLYDLKQFPGSAIMHVLRTHPYTICSGVITVNPYYQPPEEWLREHAPAALPIN